MLKRYTQLYWLFLKNRFKILMEYRANFLIGASSTLIMQGASVTAIWVVMRQVPDLNGWKLGELWLVYGLLTLSLSINHMFADNLWTLGDQYIRSGMFDRFLVRPINPLFHLLADRFNHDGIGNLIVGIGLITMASNQLELTWTASMIGYLILSVISGGMIFIGINLITSISGFWIMDSVPLIRAFFEFNEFARYPLTIYPNVIRVLLTYFIPYGLASFYPASYLLNKEVAIPLAWSAPFIAVLLFVVGYRAWLFGLSHYGSTGS